MDKYLVHNTLISEAGKKNIDWIKVEELVKKLGEDMNIRYDEDSLLSELYEVVKEGKDALFITQIFLDNGFDVQGNNGFNGAICLYRLLNSPYDRYMLPIMELLLDAGADINKEFDDLSGFLEQIRWELGAWMEDYCEDGNLYEACYQMAKRAGKNKEYNGIRSYKECRGLTVTKIEKVGYTDADFKAEDDVYDFEGSLVLWCGDTPLVVRRYVDFMVNPYVMEDAIIREDVSGLYEAVLGKRISYLEHEKDGLAELIFEDGKVIRFTRRKLTDEEHHVVGRAVLVDGNLEQGEIRESKHFLFRPICKEDYGLYFELMKDEPIVEWIFLKDMEERIRQHTLDAMMVFYWSPLIEGVQRETYTVFFKDTHDFVGEICLYRNSAGNDEIGISILKKYRGQGIGKLLIREWCKLVARVKHIKQLDVHIDEDNIPSRNGFEALGAEYVCGDSTRYYRLRIPVLPE